MPKSKSMKLDVLTFLNASKKLQSDIIKATELIPKPKYFDDSFEAWQSFLKTTGKHRGPCNIILTGPMVFIECEYFEPFVSLIKKMVIDRSWNKENKRWICSKKELNVIRQVCCNCFKEVWEFERKYCNCIQDESVGEYEF